MNRFKRVIDNYQTTTHVPEALERLVECDLALGLTNEAKQNAAVLGYNYPGSHWYGDAYALVNGAPEPDAQTRLVAACSADPFGILPNEPPRSAAAIRSCA